VRKTELVLYDLLDRLYRSQAARASGEEEVTAAEEDRGEDAVAAGQLGEDAP
jgi:hypothetical protein